MIRTGARYIVPALAALALLSGCADDTSVGTSTTAASSPASSAPGSDSAALCSGYADLK